MGYMCLGFPAKTAKGAFIKAGKEIKKLLDSEGLNTNALLSENKVQWWPCFANASFDKDKKPKGYCIIFNIGYDYPTDYIDSPDFTTRVKKWIRVGKSIGLQFQNLQFKLMKSDKEDLYRVNCMDYYRGQLAEGVPSRSLVFYIPLDNITTVKLLHLHLFFLRFLYEKHGTVDRYFELRPVLKEKYPWISRLGTLQLAEQSCKLAVAKGNDVYKSVAHSFLGFKSLHCVVNTGKKIGHSNLFQYAQGVSNFDRDLIGPPSNGLSIDLSIGRWVSNNDFMDTINNLDRIYKDKVKLYE